MKKLKDFTLKRLIEFIGNFNTIVSAILVLISLISYSPNDPNFIYPENQEINNILGINGSIAADFLLQSIGLIIIIFTNNFNIFIDNNNLSKKFNFIINSLFYMFVIQLLELFFLHSFIRSFFLIINGNGGFVGNYLYNEYFLKLQILMSKLHIISNYYYFLYSFS